MTESDIAPHVDVLVVGAGITGFLYHELEAGGGGESACTPDSVPHIAVRR
jgi:hypothetical protein